MKKPTHTPADLNIGFGVAITVEAIPDEEDAIGAILQGLVAPTTGEPGVKLFLPYRSSDNSGRIFLYEPNVEESGWQQHQEATHFKAAIAELLPHTAAREHVPLIPSFESLDQF